jgi:autotransporter translocation and assembly factor TamB
VGPDSTLVPKFSGDFELIRGRYTGVFGAEPGAVDPTVATVAPAWLADVNILGPPRSARILNRTMELDMSGDVRVVRDESGLYMLGRMDIDSGVMPVFNNTFKVVRGRLDFSREVGIVPQVDLDAETRVRLRQPDGTAIVERLTVYATGPLDKPEIAYGSESGYPREAIERMLVGLSPYPDAQADQGALAQASLGAGMNLLEREIAGEIGFFDTVDLEQIQRQQAGSSLSLDPLVGLGKYIGSDFYVKAATGFNAQDLDVVVEYQINNHLLLQTEIRSRDDEYEGANTYNLDLKYRFEY